SRILDTPEEAIERMNLLDSKHGHLERTKIIPGPDQLFSNGPELLKALKKWANERDKLIHIHSSEEPATTRWFTEEYGMTPIEYAESIEFLDEKTLLAHQVNNTEHDLDLIQNLGAMVVHNPLANTILGSGMPPVLEMIKRDIPICFSTDGSGSADNQNMLSAARLASQYQKAFHQDATVLDAEEALERITSHPARMLRLNAGILDVGKDSDFLMFDLSKPNVTPTRLETVVENLIWASAGNEIKHVVANGQVLVENYEYKTLDLNQVLTDVQKLADLFEIFKADIKTKSETGVRSS
ncbi:MAG: amidohydrolase family protein, partial [Candidatus Kariarchaeaceae archaeon]